MDPSEEETQPSRRPLHSVSRESELADLRDDINRMQRGYQGILESMGRLEVRATSIHAQLSTLKMTREISDVGIAGSCVLVALCFFVFTIRNLGVWVGWWS